MAAPCTTTSKQLKIDIARLRARNMIQGEQTHDHNSRYYHHWGWGNGCQYWLSSGKTRRWTGYTAGAASAVQWHYRAFGSYCQTTLLQRLHHPYGKGQSLSFPTFR